jgi:IS5 family transposase
MLRMYFVQHWFNLADEACEDALLDSTTLRRFVGIDLGRERVPDATTLLKFRRLLEKHELGAAPFAKVGEVLQAQGLKVGNGHHRGCHHHRSTQFDEERRRQA